jgi:class 3 adenylate cyclase
VTVLFADLKDSTELIRGLDPEAAQRLLDPALQRMMDAVHRFEGTVNQVLGDGIMALFGAPIAHTGLGRLYLAHGELEPAIRVFDQGLALCRTSGHRTNLRQIVAGLGSAYVLQGRLAEGRALLEEAISESIRTGGLSGLAHRVAWLSEVCRLAGRGEEAWQHAHEALDLARQQKARGEEAHALHQLGAVQAHANPPDAAQAEAYYQQALALAEDLGMRPLQAHCHLGLGTLYTKIGRRQQAHAELSAAIDLYRAMEMNFWLPQAEAALAKAASSESTGEADA